MTRSLNPRWQCLNPTWQNSRWLPSSSSVRMNGFESDWTKFESEFFCEMVESKMAEFNMEEFKMVAFIKFSQIELVWVRVRVEEECFWVNLREDNKVSQSKIAVFESNMADFNMVDIIKLSQNEWVWVRLNQFESQFCAKWMNPRWQNSRWKNWRWLPSLI